MNIIKKTFNNYYNSIKDNLNLEKQILLVEGITLIFITALILIFNFNKPTTLTIFYLFPLGLIIIAIENLVYASKTKEIKLKYWIINLVEGLIYLLSIIYFLFYNIENSYSFLIIFSAFIIIRNILKLFKNNKHSFLEYFNVFNIIIIGILCIIFNIYVIDDLYLYLILFYMLYGFIKLIIVLYLSKKK